MNKEDKYTEFMPRIRAINKTLFDSGSSLRDVAVFWKNCINEAKMYEVMELFYQGLTDAQIAEKTGYTINWISVVIAKGLSKNINKNKVNASAGES